MTEKEKQIKEMALSEIDLLANDINQHCPDLAENYCGNTNCLICLTHALYNAGYRKVPDGAVVLTKEEYNALLLEQKRLKEIVDRIPCGYEKKDKARKETAKEFIFKVESYFAYHDDNDTFTKEELLMSIAEVAKEHFGVEVE